MAEKTDLGGSAIPNLDRSAKRIAHDRLPGFG
jgi:hypothetical protein